MADLFGKVEEAVWKEPGEDAPAWRRRAVEVARVAWLAAESFHADSCSLRASALTLASMLALVPAMAASFATVRGLGWTGDRLETLLLQRATILSPEAVTTVVSWVDSISITSLGLMGALFAVLSAVSLLVQMEDAFDVVWGSPEGRGRVRRAADALVLLVVGPVLLAVAASSEAALRTSSAVAWLQSFGGFEVVLRGVFAFAWYALVCGAFASLYVFLPAAPVDRRAALVGGVVGGITWQFAQGVYIDFQVGLGGHNAVYGALAQLPALVFWMWTSWVIVLAGAELAAAFQNLAVCRRRYPPVLVGVASRERLALALAVELAEAAYARRPAPTLAGLAGALGMPVRTVTEVFSALDRAGLVHTGGEAQKQCFLSLSPGSVPLDRVVAAARGEGDDVEIEAGAAASRVFERLAAARREALGPSTLADLVDERGTLSAVPRARAHRDRPPDAA